MDSESRSKSSPKKMNKLSPLVPHSPHEPKKAQRAQIEPTPAVSRTGEITDVPSPRTMCQSETSERSSVTPILTADRSEQIVVAIELFFDEENLPVRIRHQITEFAFDRVDRSTDHPKPEKNGSTFTYVNDRNFDSWYF